MAFADYASELLGHIPALDYLLAQKLVNRGWKDIREARLWSWLRFFGVLLAPQIVTAGTATATQFSSTISLDATANAALNNLQNPLITQRQFRLGAGPLYNITAYNNAGATLTLDRLYMEKSSVGSYQVYRCYFQPADQNGALVSDFLMFSEMFNPVEGYAIVGPNLRLTRGELDARDPTRGAQDVAYTVASFTVDANGIPFYELWPHPTNQRAYPYLGRKRGLDLSATVDIPQTVSSHMVIERAKFYAYDWAIANVGKFPELKDVDWRLLKAESQRVFDNGKGMGMLPDAKRNDDNLQLENYIPQLRDYLSYPPIDSKFLQSHDMGDWASG